MIIYMSIIDELLIIKESANAKNISVFISSDLTNRCKKFWRKQMSDVKKLYFNVSRYDVVIFNSAELIPVRLIFGMLRIFDFPCCVWNWMSERFSHRITKKPPQNRNNRSDCQTQRTILSLKIQFWGLSDYYNFYFFLIY